MYRGSESVAPIVVASRWEIAVNCALVMVACGGPGPFWQPDTGVQDSETGPCPGTGPDE